MEIFKHKIMINEKASRLPPGFRFHLNDGELVFEYLAKKIFKHPMSYSLLEIESCNVDHWELFGERDRERYFFVKKKIGREENRRETTSGFWEESEPETEIEASDTNNIANNYPVNRIKKSLVFFSGSKPHGSITQWAMEEYHLVYSKSIWPSTIRHQEWIAVRILRNIEKGTEKGNMDDATFSWSSSTSESVNDESESDGEEVIQSI